jgi:hypothetical protein
MQEKNFENRVKRWLQSQGVYAVGTPKQKMTVPAVGYYEKRFGNAFTVAGLPDLHISIKGVDLEIELKAPKGKPSMLQIRMIEQMRQSGSLAYIVYEKIKGNKDGHYIDFGTFKSIVGDLIDG